MLKKQFNGRKSDDRRQLVRYVCLILILFCCFQANSQAPGNWTIDGRLYTGKIIKHNPDILFDPPSLSQGYELALHWQGYGRKEWQEWQAFPKLGLAISHFNLGERDTVGYASAIRYLISRKLYQSKKWQIDFEFGGGFAWLDRPFNRLSNQRNTAIGSSLNMHANLFFKANYQLSKHWTAVGGLALSHYSNGAAQLPNLGINVASITLGVAYTPKPLEPESFLHHNIPKSISRDWGIRFEYAIGYREVQTIGGPRYPVHTFSLAGRYSLNKVNRVFAGLAYEYNRAAYDFGNAVFEFNSEREAFWGASRISIFAEDEFLFGSFSVALQAGYYLGDFSYLVPNDFYLKLNHRYYFRLLRHPELRVFAGVILKSHWSVAEHFAFSMGLDF